MIFLPAQPSCRTCCSAARTCCHWPRAAIAPGQVAAWLVSSSARACIDSMSGSPASAAPISDCGRRAARPAGPPLRLAASPSLQVLRELLHAGTAVGVEQLLVAFEVLLHRMGAVAVGLAPPGQPRGRRAPLAAYPSMASCTQADQGHLPTPACSACARHQRRQVARAPHVVRPALSTATRASPRRRGTRCRGSSRSKPDSPGIIRSVRISAKRPVRQHSSAGATAAH
jgi:hypothetical protein